MMIHPAGIFGSRSAFFFKYFKKKKKKKKKIFFQNRFKNIITFPKRHGNNFLEIFPIVKSPYAFWSWICLWRFLTKLGNSRYEKKISAGSRISAEGRTPCRRQGSLLISLIKSILSGGPSRRQLYPSRWYRFFFSKKML